MSKLESEYKAEFLTEVRKWGAYCYSLAANMYMSGQPDSTIVTNKAYVFQLEFKVWRNVGIPTVEQMLGLLKGPQVNVIKHQMWPRGVYVPIVAFKQSEPTKCYHAFRSMDVTLHNWTELAKYYASLEYKSYKEVK